PHRRVALQQTQNYIVSRSLSAESIALGARELRRRHGKRGPRLELGADGGNGGGAVRDDAEKNRRQPDEQHAQRVEDDRLAEVSDPSRRQAEDADVRKRDR